MSLLARAKLSARGTRFSVHSIAALLQFNFYSTKTTPFTPKTQRSTKNTKTLNPSQSPSLSDTIKNQTGSMIDWPKPIEIPYQAKVANSVNLIGRVKTPIQFDSASDENHFAAAVITQENGAADNSLLIPVLFEGDLAHAVACHVKENDRVYVSGQLSVGPTRFAFNETLGKFHLLADNLNFVEGFKKNVPGKKSSVVTPLAKKTEEVTEEVVTSEDGEFDQKSKEALEYAKDKKISGESDWALRPGCKQTNDEANSETSVVESAKTKKTQGLDLWRDLAKSPHQWWDYRDHKSNRLVKEKHPDFKHKETGDGLWVDSAPDWVLSGLGKLEFDVKFMKAKPVPGGEGFAEKKEFGVKFAKGKGKGGEELWKSLVDNPSKWWDNRLDKRNPRAPDFKNKETGEGLWLSDSPDWAVSGLPQLRDGKNYNM